MADDLRIERVACKSFGRYEAVPPVVSPNKSLSFETAFPEDRPASVGVLLEEDVDAAALFARAVTEAPAPTLDVADEEVARARL